MKNQALFSSKDKSQKFECHLLQFLFGTLRVNTHLSADTSLFFCSKPLSKSCFHGHCIFPHNLKQKQGVFARGCVENYSA